MNNQKTQETKMTYTVMEIAKMLGIGRTSAYNLVKENHFKVVKIGVPSQQKWTQKSFKKRNESYSFFCFRKTAAFIPRFA